VLDALLLSLDAPHMVLDGLDLELGFHSAVSLALLHHWRCMKSRRVREVRPTLFVGKGVRMAHFGSISLLKLIFHLHDPSSSIYSKSGLNMKRELEGISNEKNFGSGAHF